MDAILAKQRFLAGDKFTEADLLLFPTMIRFDTAYAILFKCSKKRAVDYPHLFAWMRDVHQLPLPSPELLQVRVGEAWLRRALDAHPAHTATSHSSDPSLAS